MLESLQESFEDLLRRGGPVMWPLLAMSLLAVALAFERCWFWLRTNRPSRLSHVRRLSRLLRQGDAAKVRVLVEDDRSVYGRVLHMLLEQGPSEAVQVEAIESQRPRLERFMTTLSTIITAAPLLGILGTVLGIIASFGVLAEQTGATDPRSVSLGISEALLTTAAGLLVAIVVLFPYNAFRTQIDRTLGRLEVLASAARRTVASSERPSKDPRARSQDAQTVTSHPRAG